MNTIYFDHAATTKLDEEVLEEMMPYLTDEYGNASTIYQLGRSSRNAIETAREKIAKSIHAEPSEIYFTSGGTESDNTAIRGIAYGYQEKGNHIITSKIEHPAVLETCKQLENEGFEVTYLDVNENGIVDVEQLKKSIKETTTLISIMFANNEVGTIQPVAEIGKIAREKHIYFHTDSVQAIGSIAIDVNEMNIDSLSMSAHKFYGPKGIGALYVRKGIMFQKYMNGGHQERDKRAGTENVPAIVGMGKAIEIAYRDLESHTKYIKELREYYEREVERQIPDIKINGDRNQRLPGNSNISFKGIEAESLLINLDLKGICTSSGSACTSRFTGSVSCTFGYGATKRISTGKFKNINWKK